MLKPGSQLDDQIQANADAIAALQAVVSSNTAAIAANTAAIAANTALIAGYHSGEPGPDPDPTPDPELEYIQPLWLSGNDPNSRWWNEELGVMVFENLYVKGRMTLNNMPNVIVRNVVCDGNEDSVRDDGTVEWGHLNIRNCPGALIEDYTSINNSQGHGIHLTGLLDDIRIYRPNCTGAQEDGLQTSNSSTNTPGKKFYVYDGFFSDNDENSVDLKGGEGEFHNCYLDGSAPGHEPFLTHRIFVSALLQNCIIADSGHGKALGSVNIGFVTLRDCEFLADPNGRGFRQETDEYTVQQCVNGLERPWCSIQGCTIG